MTDRNVVLPVTSRDFSQYGAPSWAKFKIIFRKDSNYEDFRGTKFYRTEEAARNALTKKDNLIQKTKLANLKPKEPAKADKFLIKVGNPTKANNVIKQKFKEVIGSKNVPSTYKETGVEKTLYRAQISVNDKTVLSTEFGKESDAIKAVRDYRKTNPIKNAPPDLETLDARKKKRYLEKQKRSKEILARGGYPSAGPFVGDVEIHKGHAGNIRGKEMITGDRLIRTPAIINQMMGGDESIATKNRFTDLDYKIEDASNKIEEVKNSNMSAAKKKIELDKLDTKLMKYAADSDGYKVVTLSDGNTYGEFVRPLQSIDPFGDFPGMTEKEIGSFLNKYKNMKVTPGMPQSEIDNIIKAGMFIENMDVSKQVAKRANDLFKLARKDAIANGPICGIVQKKNKGGSVISCVDAVEDAIQNNPQKLAQDASKIGKFKQAATGFLGFLKSPGFKTFGAAGVAGTVGAGIVKAFRNDDPTTYLSDENQQKNMLVAMATDPITTELPRPDILDYQLPAAGALVAASTAAVAPKTIKASKARGFGIEQKRPGIVKTGFRTLGRGLGVAASPGLLAPLAAMDITSQVSEGDSPADIATDPLNYLYPVFAEQTPKLTRGLPAAARKIASLGLGRLGLTILSRAGLAGLGLSLGIQGYKALTDD